MKSWFEIDGHLSELEFDGPSHFRFPTKLAELVIRTYSSPMNWVLDPFAGFGTTIHVAANLGRQGVGLEIDARRAEFANKGLSSPNIVINDSAKNVRKLSGLYSFDLLFTSPPYISVRLEDDPWGSNYFGDMRDIFQKIKPLLSRQAKIVIEVSNIRKGNGLRPLAWQFAELLAGIYEFQGEVIRCNSSDVEAGPGYNHSYLLVFANTKPERSEECFVSNPIHATSNGDFQNHREIL